ncbi:MAG: 8-oxo-dGTP diphosphatase MutT [Proteobacteria bacterium]|nr:8-oxo-dGTP diphosphatase MutT [Pseudomonadota bacterium]
MIPPYLLNRPFLPVATERLTLRPLEEKDAASMAVLANDRSIAERLARLPHPYTIEDALKFIAYAQEGIKKGTHVIFAVIRRADQTFMGVVGSEEALGYWLGEEFWGQGYGKEAMRAVVQFCFGVLQREELRAAALVDNIPSRRIIEGLGFLQSGAKEMTSLGYEGTKPGIEYLLSRKDYMEHYNTSKHQILWVVAAAIINKKGELLITERPMGKALAGVWELPGGKMELGETPENSLIRELKEELGIKVREDDLEPLSFASYRYETFHLIMPIYLCHQWEGNLHGAEGQKIAWITYTDLAYYPLPPADILPAHRLADILNERGIW